MAKRKKKGLTEDGNHTERKTQAFFKRPNFKKKERLFNQAGELGVGARAQHLWKESQTR